MEWTVEMGRLTRRLFLLLWVVQAVTAMAASPSVTTVRDTVYRADGTPARGTVLITWPAFTTADRKPVAAGTLNLTLGTDGSLTVALAPNAGATPSGTYYRVVLQLDDGSNSTSTGRCRRGRPRHCRRSAPSWRRTWLRR